MSPAELIARGVTAVPDNVAAVLCGGPGVLLALTPAESECLSRMARDYTPHLPADAPHAASVRRKIERALSEYPREPNAS